MHYFKWMGSREAMRLLWENKEALGKYTDRLLELYKPGKMSGPIVVNNLCYKWLGYSLGEMVREEMKERGLSLEQLARASDLPVRTVGEIAGDEIWPNCVPVMLMIRLLEELGIRGDVGVGGMERTGDRLGKGK